jgi:phosphoribosylformylglycinamidine cyclo-ligase
MCVNDIICHNARPLFFLDYIGCGKLDPRVATAIVEGIARGCMLAGAGLVGGETAQMPGLYQKGEYDLAGFAVGIAERSKIPRPAALRAGDVIIGLASNGLHSNGFSLARKVLLERGRLRLGQRIAELGCALSDELLRPTTIYARIAAELFEKCAIKGLANITGGGIPENLPRILPAGLYAEIHRGSWQIPPIFDLIRRSGRLEQAEMDRTFNNGVGMIAIVAARDADTALAYLKRRRASRVGASIIGRLRRGARGVTFV